MLLPQATFDYGPKFCVQFIKKGAIGNISTYIYLCLHFMY